MQIFKPSAKYLRILSVNEAKMFYFFGQIFYILMRVDLI